MSEKPTKRRLWDFISLVRDARAAVVAIIVGATLTFGYSWHTAKKPPWMRDWQEVDAMNGYENGDPEHWKWSGMRLAPVSSQPTKMQVFGLPAGATFLEFSTPSLKRSMPSDLPRTGTVICGHHSGPVSSFDFWLKESNFVCLQFRARDGALVEEYWFRVDEGNTIDCAGRTVTDAQNLASSRRTDIRNGAVPPMM